ncbi:TetR/AcrR family transcriptional regulator [Lacticaseibacillus suilingensis]|uniref:TetR/AcrR family transcriptional regulator n=1 Tax=Lacticaseibacillus suilingensis TaxID=2799577 RepID=A0ABW4BHP1_9LACO|nr:TetR/AcrR family transcriptional regulator [Lacticaseibacillus suilingensis]
MKYDPAQKTTRGAVRTLKAFSETMLIMLGEKPFEKISVNALCEAADYPRATFYNYFDDKYDLLTYCWYRMRREVHLDQISGDPTDASFMAAFDQIYHLFDSHHDLLIAVVSHNPLDSQLVNHFIQYFTSVFTELFTARAKPQELKTPVELVAKHYSSTVLLIMEWIFLGQHPTTREEAEVYVRELLEPRFTCVE